MFARKISIHLKPNTLAEFTTILEQNVIPLLRKQRGFKDEITFAAAGSTDVLAISLWDTKPNAEAYDGDGYKDDVHGWDFVHNTNNPYDEQNHGSYTASVLVANRFVNTGNSKGYSGDGATYQGVASGAKVIPLKVIDGNLVSGRTFHDHGKYIALHKAKLQPAMASIMDRNLRLLSL